MKTPSRLTAVLTAGCLLLPGCGSTTTPAEEVPQLEQALSAVDAALIEDRPEQARRRVRDLVATAEAARLAGDLADADAKRIRDAAQNLLSALPDRPTATSTPAPATGEDREDDDVESPEPEEAEKDEDDGAETEVEADDDDGNDKGKGKRRGKSDGTSDGKGKGNGKAKGKG